MKVALIFPGQGSQSVGMGKELYDSSPEAKKIFEQADTIIEGLNDVIFNGPEDKLTSTKYCQPAIFTVNCAALAALKSNEKFSQFNPMFTCGHSLGEYAAIVAGGALSFEDALKLVERRSFFMEEATKEADGAMAAVIGLDKDKLVSICEETGAQLANFNSLEQIVITGESSKVDSACAKCEEAGAKRVIKLPVGGAFHSSLMKGAQEKFEGELSKFSFNTPDIPIISNVNAKPETDPAAIKTNLAKQITSSVLWVDTIQFVAKEEVTHFLEIGPGNVLKGLIRRIDRDLSVQCVRTQSDIESLNI